MRVYYLTAIGNSVVSNPSHDNADTTLVLYRLRRNGGQSTDEKLKDQLGWDGIRLRRALGELVNNQAVKFVGG